MSNLDKATENPTDKLPAGKPLKHDEIVPEEFEDEGRAADAASTPMQRIGEDRGTPGHQERPLTEDERLEKSLEDSFPTSDPIQPSRIDGPNN